MRVALLAGILLAPAIALAHGVRLGRRLERFLAGVTELASEDQIARLRALVEGQMIGNLVQLMLMVVPFVLFAIGHVIGLISLLEFFPWVLLPFLAVVGLGIYYTKPEREVRELPAATDELRDERNRIVRVWRRRLSPDR